MVGLKNGTWSPTNTRVDKLGNMFPCLLQLWDKHGNCVVQSLSILTIATMDYSILQNVVCLYPCRLLRVHFFAIISIKPPNTGPNFIKSKYH